MTKDEALRLALEALETCIYPQQKQFRAIAAIKHALAAPVQTDWEAIAADQAMTIALLKSEAAAQPATKKSSATQPVQEPVAWINAEKRTFEWSGPVLWNTPTVAVLDKIPLYTTPPNVATPLAAQRQWVGLTDESVVSAAARVLSDRVAASCNVDCGDMWMLHGNDSIEDARAMLEAAEAKLKEKNT